MDFKNQTNIIFAKLALGTKLKYFNLDNPEHAKIVEVAIWAYFSGIKAGFSALNIETKRKLMGIAYDFASFIDPDVTLTIKEKKCLLTLTNDQVREALDPKLF